MDRRTSTLILALALMAVVMIIVVVLYFNGSPREKWIVEQRWEAAMADAETLKGINMAGDKTDEVFVQSPQRLLILDATGQKLLDLSLQNGKTTMGDLNGDDLDEFVAVQQAGGESPTATAYTAAGQQLWSRALPSLGQPARATSVDLTGDRVREIIVGDDQGQLVCLSSDSQVLWSFRLPNAPADNRYVRGLDDVTLGDGRSAVAAANYKGDVVLLDANGQEVWRLFFPQPLRRLRAYDLDGDGAAEVILGGENGLVLALNRQDGQVLWQASAGGRVTEMRDADLNGDPATRELLIGTRDGLVLGLDGKGQQVFRASLGSRVQALSGVDLDGDGRDEVVAGSETGKLALFRSDGEGLATINLDSAVAEVDSGKRLGEGEFLVSSARNVSRQRASVEKAPFWYNPLTAGLLACLVIAVAAWGLSGLQRPPRLAYSAEDVTVEALQAKRRMLKESLAEVHHLQESGEMPPDAYTARTRELRAHVARVEAELIKQGVKITSEVMQCPNCGGAIELGADRCEYCGQTIV